MILVWILQHLMLANMWCTSSKTGSNWMERNKAARQVRRGSSHKRKTTTPTRSGFKLSNLEHHFQTTLPDWCVSAVSTVPSVWSWKHCTTRSSFRIQPGGQSQSAVTYTGKTLSALQSFTHSLMNDRRAARPPELQNLLL